MSTLNSITPVLGSNPELPPTLRLTHEFNLLHLLFYRNKNQHRLSKWWKDLSLLRSNVRKLISELESLQELQTGKPAAPALAGSGMTKTQLKKLRKMEKEKANAAHIQTAGISGVDAIVKARERVDARLRLLRRGIIPRAWVAFTGVVATIQFSALGMVLMGVLGRIYETIGPGSAEEQEAMKAVEEGRMLGGVGGAEAEKGWGGRRRGGGSGWVHGGEEEEEEQLGGEGFDDGGVIISRELMGEEGEILGGEDEEGELRTLAERVEVIETEEREISSPTDVVEDTEMQDGESESETARQMSAVALPEKDVRKKKQEELRKSKETMLPPPPPSSRPSKPAPVIPDLDFFLSSATPAIASTPVIATAADPKKRKPKSEPTKTGDIDKPRKKKKKKGNVIDDIFKGLI